MDGSRRGSAAGVATLLGSGAANQLGAAVAAQAFGAIGPAGVVAVRQLVAAVVLMPTVRPPLRRMTRAQWWPVLALGVVFVVMNLGLYTAVDRVGLGLAVTLEFLGPLAVALASSRTALHLLCAAGAGIGVYVLVLPGPSSDLVGLGCALVAGCGWAAYILLNRTLGQRLPGLQGTAAAALVATCMSFPVLAWLALSGRLTPSALALAAVAGLLSSAVPYAVDLLVLRRVPARLFGVVMSVNPALAALAGLVVLGQSLAAHEWTGIAIVAGVNAVATFPRRIRVRRLPPSSGGVEHRVPAPDAPADAPAADPR